jgi:hypothetical protein
MVWVTGTEPIRDWNTESKTDKYYWCPPKINNFLVFSLDTVLLQRKYYSVKNTTQVWPKLVSLVSFLIYSMDIRMGLYDKSCEIRWEHDEILAELLSHYKC